MDIASNTVNQFVSTPRAVAGKCAAQASEILTTFMMNAMIMAAFPNNRLQGSTYRLLLLLIIKEVKKTKSPVIRIGRLHSQATRILKNTQQIEKIEKESFLINQILHLFSSISKDDVSVIDSNNLLWNPLRGNIRSSSTVVLTKIFFDELMDFPNLIDMSVINKISYSERKINIYIWIEHCRYFFNSQHLFSWEFIDVLFFSNHELSVSEIKESFLCEFNEIYDCKQCDGVDVTNEGILIN